MGIGMGMGMGLQHRRTWVQCSGLLTERASAPETHLKDIWGWGISGEHGGKVIVNKGERAGGSRHGWWMMVEMVPPTPGEVVCLMGCI